VNPRLERILITQARRSAPQLLEMGLMDAPALARQLASFNILILMGDTGQPLDQSYPQVQMWVDGYINLYDLLATNLFPSFTQISANYADAELPAIIIINGAATPVLEVIAGFVVPYVAQRQGRRGVSEAEIVGLMDEILDQLEAGDLSREEYRRLRAEGTQFLKDMLNAPVKQLPLMRFDRPIIEELPDEPVIEATPPPTMPPPPRLPETVKPDTQPQPAIKSAPPAPPKPDSFPERPTEPVKPVQPSEVKAETAPSPPPANPVGLPPLDTSRRRRRPPVPDLPGDKE
jgi:hypothetical protein